MDKLTGQSSNFKRSPEFAGDQRAESLRLLREAGSQGVSKEVLIFEKHFTQCGAIAPTDRGQSTDCCSIFAGQARLLAERAERGLAITSGSLVRLVRFAEQLDAELALESRQ